MKEKVELLQILLNCSEALAVLAGMAVLRFVKDTRIKAFIAYLVFIFICEMLGWYFKNNSFKTVNVAMYNYLVMPVEFLFSIWFLYSYMPNRKTKILCVVFSVLNVFSRIIELTFLRKEKFFFSSLSYVTSSLLLLIVILLFLWKFIKSEKLLQYDRYFEFWVAMAVLIYYLGSFPLWAFYNYLYGINKDVFYLYWEIQMYLNMLMYLLFTTALLWTHLKYRSSLR